MMRFIATAASLLLVLSCAKESNAAADNKVPDAAATPAAASAPAPDPRYAPLGKLGFSVFPEPQDIPAIALSTPDGKALGVDAFKGKFVVLNFWATWCPPCRAEMPSMSELHAKYADKDLVVYAVSVQEDAGTVKNYLKDKKYAFPIVLDPDGAISKLFVGSGIPTTYVLDRDGRAVAGMVGGREWNTPEAYGIFEAIFKN